MAQTKRIDEANATISANITSEQMAKLSEKIAQRLSKTARLDGFRKGKIPLSVIKQRFGSSIQDEARDEALKEVYEQGLKDLGIKTVIGDPLVEKFDEKDGAYDVQIKVCTQPEFELGEYLSVIPKIKKPRITQEKINQRLEKIARSYTDPSVVEEDRGVENGDFVVFDFLGKIDDVPFDGGKADNYTLEIGSNSFIAGFEDGMIGMKKGDKKDVKATFPKSYHAQDLAGKDAIFEVSLHEIKQIKDVKVDDELAKKILSNDKEASLDKLKELLKEQLIEEDKTKQYQDGMREKISTALSDFYDFALPQNLVEKELDYVLREKTSTMEKSEIEEITKDEKKLQSLKDEHTKTAQDKVRLTLAVNVLASELKLRVSDQEVEQLLYYEAMNAGQNPTELIALYKEQNIFPAIKMSVLEDKVFKKLLDLKLEEKPAKKDKE